MAAIECLTIAREIDNRLEAVDKTLTGVDHKVGSVVKGEPYRISFPPNLFSALPD